MNRLVRFSVLGWATAVAVAFAQPAAVGVSQPAEYIVLLGVIRDFPPLSQHPDFLATPSAPLGIRSARNIALTLDAASKPVYVGGGRRVISEYRDVTGRRIAWCAPVAAGDVAGTIGAADSGGIASVTTFAQWFRDLPGVNMSRSWSIRLDRQPSGNYLFDAGDFHPIDCQLLGNGPDGHNHGFTYEIDCTFTAAPGQFVSFTGDDDAWVFIDNRLVIDHGGIDAPRRQTITFDRLALTAGETYELRLFFAERSQTPSQFRLETNIDTLSSASFVAVMAACD